MGSEATDQVRYCFEDCTLDAQRRELLKAGEPVAIEPQVFDILLFLIQERDRVVTRDDLFETVWKGRVVSESTLASRVNAVRRVIGDNGEAQRLIRTIQRKGIRFVGAVTEQADEVEAPAETPLALPMPVSVPLPLPDKPSIAVLPFVSMSDEPEQAYFADGMTAEIITALARLRSLFVIAGNSTMIYKGQMVDVRVVGRDLGVRYVLEGSVRRSQDKVRFIARLVDATNGAHIWTDRFDGVLGDLFELQDQITEAVANLIEPAIQHAEIERTRRKPLNSLGAYDHYLKALTFLDIATRDGAASLLEHASLSIEMDPDFAPAYTLAARAYIMRKVQGYSDDDAQDAREVLNIVERGLRVDRFDAAMLAAAGLCYAWFAHDLAKGMNYANEAMTLNPNHAHAFIVSGFLRTLAGQMRLAIEHFGRAHRLNPRDSRAYSAFAVTSLAYQFEDDPATAYDWAIRSVQLNPDFIIGWLQVVTTCELLGRAQEARSAAARVLAINATFSVRKHQQSFPTNVPDKAERYAQALIKAGLPE